MSDVRTESRTDSRGGSPMAAINRMQGLALPALAVGAIGIAIGYFMDQSAGKKVFWAAYMYGFMFWMGLTLGCTTLTFLHHTIRAQWSFSLLRIIEAGNKLLPVMFVLWLPLVIGALNGQVFPWADPTIYATLHHNKQVWLNKPFWIGRGVFYFAYWIFMTSRLNASSKRQDETQDNSLFYSRANLAAPGGVIHVVLLTFAITDWLMSLDPPWFSTLYGAWHMTTEVLATLAFGTALILLLRKFRPFDQIVSASLTKDLGNLMLAFTMIYGYFTLSQFLIIWSANLPEEIRFFTARFDGGLVILGGLLVVGQFFGPFLALIAGKTKRTPEILQRVAIWIFVVRMIDSWWQIVPYFKRFNGLSAGDFPGLLLDIAGFAAVGGLWVFLFFGNFKKNDMVALHDTRLQETKAQLEAGHA